MAAVIESNSFLEHFITMSIMFAPMIVLKPLLLFSPADQSKTVS